MGTDIHLHLEVKTRNQKNWQKVLFVGGEFLLYRHYPLFRRLYGNSEYLNSEIQYVVPYRGFPVDVSSEVFTEYAREVVGESEMLLDNKISVLDANHWIETKQCQYVNNESLQGVYVNDPDYHTANWINSKELEKCMCDIQNMECWENSENEFCWYVLYQNMKLYETQQHCEVRAVYWFDN